jgi:transcriptional regulator with XRE-family HTH domain
MLKDRVKQVMESESLTPKEFSEKLSIQRSSLSHVFSGRNKPSLDFIMKLTQVFPHLSMEWILHGRGEMHSKQLSSADSNPVTNVTSETVLVQNDVQNKVSAQVSSDGKTISKIIIFYNDGSFSEHDPSGIS